MGGTALSAMQWLWMLGLPEGTPRQLLGACRVLAPTATALWVLVVANIWVDWSARAMSAARTGAAVTIVLGAMCWLTALAWHRLDDLVDGRLVDIICGLARSRAQEGRQHLRPAAGERPQGH